MSFEPIGRDLTGTRVLVVDDDSDMRALLRGILEDAGFSIGEAQDGQVALDLLRQTRESWVVLTDHVMPRLNGAGLIAAVVGDPQLRARHAFIYMSAADWGIEPDLHLQLEALHAPILSKPFFSAECIALVTSAAQRLANMTV